MKSYIRPPKLTEIASRQMPGCFDIYRSGFSDLLEWIQSNTEPPTKTLCHMLGHQI